MFRTKLVCTQIEDDLWEVHEPLVYDAGRFGVITVPPGFKTDFASVPRAPLAWLYCGGQGEAAAVVHDYLYKIGGMPRKDVDTIFYMALRNMGISGFKAGVMYRAVRIGGWTMWDKYRSEQNGRNDK